LTENQGDGDAFKSAIDNLLSGTPVSGAAMQRRIDHYAPMFPTADPTMIAQDLEYVQQMLAVRRAEPAQATANAEYVDPTPDWNPYWSAAEEYENYIDKCQADYRVDPSLYPIAFGIDDVRWDGVVVDGDDATALATVSDWYEYQDYPSGARVTRKKTDESFMLKKSAGAWRIAS
jgi:hypothetical protein